MRRRQNTRHLRTNKSNKLLRKYRTETTVDSGFSKQIKKLMTA